jgi:REP element-mobilizing transposase RayT
VKRQASSAAAYKRNLPHLQRRNATVFVTFATRRRWVLPESVRRDVLGHCIYDHRVKVIMHAAVVMPDHVHLLFSPLAGQDGEPHTLAEIMSSIKGASAHTVNRKLARRGNVLGGRIRPPAAIRRVDPPEGGLHLRES